MNPSVKVYRVSKAYQSPYPDPICFQEGEIVQVGELFTEDPDWENWVWCWGQAGKAAWIPEQFLRIDGSLGIFIREYNAQELNVTNGEILLVHEMVNGFGMAEKKDGSRGWVPLNHLTLESP